MSLPQLLTVLFVIIFTSKKDLRGQSSTELLTQKVWTLVSYGYDSNGNGVIDASEESIRDCDKDNQYSFAIDGNGLFEENFLSCGNGITEMQFTWKFIHNETTLDFANGAAKIILLNDDRLIISDTTRFDSQSLRYIQTFTH